MIPSNTIERELRRLSAAAPYVIPSDEWRICRANQHLLKDTHGTFPAFPTEGDLAGMYNVYQFKGRCLPQDDSSDTSIFVSVEQSITGTLELSIQHVPGRVSAGNGDKVRVLWPGRWSYRYQAAFLQGHLRLDATENELVSLPSECVITQHCRKERNCNLAERVGIRVNPADHLTEYCGYGTTLLAKLGPLRFPNMPSTLHIRKVCQRISLTMELNIPMELSRIVREYLEPPPVQFIEPNDLILDIISCFSGSTVPSIIFARRRQKKDPPPLVRPVESKSSCCIQ